MNSINSQIIEQQDAFVIQRQKSSLADEHEKLILYFAV